MARVIQGDCVARFRRAYASRQSEGSAGDGTKGHPEAATILTVSFGEVCLTDRRMIRRSLTTALRARASGLFHQLSSIENQYEFVLGHWVNDSEFAGSVRLNPKSKDPMIGTQDPAESIFVIPQADGAPPIKGHRVLNFYYDESCGLLLSTCSITAIKFISGLGCETFMLFVTRWFGVTASDADRDLSRERADIETIKERSLLMQANAASQQHRTLARRMGTHAKRRLRTRLNSRYLMLPKTRDPALQQHGSRRGCSRSPASIPQWFGLEMLTRRRTLILKADVRSLSFSVDLTRQEAQSFPPSGF